LKDIIKKHIFSFHDDIEKRSKYCETLEWFINSYYMSVLRLIQFEKIDKDQLNLVIEEQLSVHQQLMMNEIWYHFQFSNDLDRSKAEKRGLLYLKKREIAMKFCKFVPYELKEHEPF
jgi:hypothetical protein